MSFKYCGRVKSGCSWGFVFAGLGQKSKAGSIPNGMAKLDYAIWIHLQYNLVEVYENGKKKKTIGSGGGMKSATFGVRVNDQKRVEYTINGGVRYTSTATPTFPLVADVQMYSDGKASDIKWTEG